MVYWNEWLPLDVASNILTKESDKFHALVESYHSAVNGARASTCPNRWTQTVRWVPLINNYMKTKTKYALEDLNMLALDMWEVALSTKSDVEVQDRTASSLASILFQFKRDLDLKLDWRTLHAVLVSFLDRSAPCIEGAGIQASLMATLMYLGRASSRFFQVSSVLEFWDAISPGLQGTVEQAFEAASLLVSLTNTHALSKDPEGSKLFLSHVIAAWETRIFNNDWDEVWLYLLARLAKHDEHGVLDWSPYTARIFTSIIQQANFPVGSSSASQVPVARPTPFEFKMLSFYKKEAGWSGAYLAIYLLKVDPLRSATVTRATEVLGQFEKLVELIEQFYHPSNGGKWTSFLTSFLQHSVSALVRQIGLQGVDPKPGFTALPADLLGRIAASLMRLASRGMYSKDKGLSEKSQNALSQLAYIAPTQVLPLVVERFRSALEAESSPHQLASSITTLALCVRPMLLAAWNPSEEETGPQFLAEAMMAVLPGIDANDMSKTEAVLLFYTSVLSCIPSLTEPGEEGDAASSGQVILPLFSEEWASELVSRLFSLFAALDTGVGGTQEGDGAASKKSGGDTWSPEDSGAFADELGVYLLPDLMFLVFCRLPRDSAKRLAITVTNLAVSTPLPGVFQEVLTMLSAATCALPQQVALPIVIPALLAAAKKALPEPGLPHPPSTTCEMLAAYYLSLLGDVICRLEPKLVPGFVQETTALADAALACSSKILQRSGAGLIRKLLLGLLSHRFNDSIEDNLPAPPLVGPPSSKILAWVDKDGQGFSKKPWKEATAAEAVVANQLLEKYLVRGCEELTSLSGIGSGGSAGEPMSTAARKLRLHALLIQIDDVLTGISVNLPDFELPAPSSGAVDLTLSGGSGIPAGSAALRVLVAESLCRASRSLVQSDPSLLPLVVHSMLLTGSAGTHEFETAEEWQEDEKNTKKLLTEPASAVLLNPDMKPSKRMPLWLSELKARRMLHFRTSQRHFRYWVNSTQPELDELSGDPASAATKGQREVPAAVVEIHKSLLMLACYEDPAVQNEAVEAVQTLLKRFPALSRTSLSILLATLAGLPSPSAMTSEAALAELEAALAESSEGVKAMEVYTQSELDARVKGATETISHSLSLWRAIFRDPRLLSLVLRALMASRGYNSIASQASISSLAIQLASRLRHPPSLDYSTPDYLILVERLLALASLSAMGSTVGPSGSGAGRAGSAWRYALLGGMGSLLMLPRPVVPNAPRQLFAGAFMSWLVCDIFPLRRIAFVGLFFVLKPIIQADSDPNGVPTTVATCMTAPDWGTRFLTSLAHGHTRLDAAETNADKRGGSMAQRLQALLSAMANFEDFLVGILNGGISRYETFFEGEEQPLAAKDGLFETSNFLLARLLGSVTGSVALDALLPALTGILGDPSRLAPLNTSDKAEVATCAELVSGLMASGAAWLSPGAQRLQELFSGALRHSSLEIAEAWTVAIRLAIRGLLDLSFGHASSSQLPNLPQADALKALGWLLDTVMAGNDGEGVSGNMAEAKRMRYMTAAVMELSKSTYDTESLPEVRRFWSVILVHCNALLQEECLALRELAGPLLAHTLSRLAPRRLAAGGVEASSTSTSTMEVDDPSAASDLQHQAAALAHNLLQSFTLAAQAVSLLRNGTVPLSQDTGGSNGVTPPVFQLAPAEESAMAESTGREEASILPRQLSALGLGLQFVSATVTEGDVLKLMPLLLAFLPPLFLLQGLVGPVLEKLALEARRAQVLLKYIPLRHREDVSMVMAAVQEAAQRPEPWSSRASALLFVQYTWFLHLMLIPAAEEAALVSVLMSRLEDPKAEVRAAAVETLSGVLRGLTAEDRQRVIGTALDRGKRWLRREPAGIKRKSQPSLPQPTALQQLGAVAGLSALLSSAPYDVPAWLPDVLTTLVPATGPSAPGTVRSGAVAALAEFKRTHEADSIRQLKGMMNEDAWEAYTAATSAASYFS